MAFHTLESVANGQPDTNGKVNCKLGKYINAFTLASFTRLPLLQPGDDCPPERVKITTKHTVSDVEDHNKNSPPVRFRPRRPISAEISHLCRRFYSAQVCALQAQVHSVFLYFHNPMGQQSDTTGERSGAGPLAYRAFRGTGVSYLQLPNSGLLLRNFY